MKAQPLFDRRVKVADNAFAEIVAWRLPSPLGGCTHVYKYRLAFVVNNRCVVRYDNERGKGDHRHYGRREARYEFNGIDRLIEDFMADVERWRNEHSDA